MFSTSGTSRQFTIAVLLNQAKCRHTDSYIYCTSRVLISCSSILDNTEYVLFKSRSHIQATNVNLSALCDRRPKFKCLHERKSKEEFWEINWHLRTFLLEISSSKGIQPFERARLCKHGHNSTADVIQPKVRLTVEILSRTHTLLLRKLMERTITKKLFTSLENTDHIVPGHFGFSSTSPQTLKFMDYEKKS